MSEPQEPREGGKSRRPRKTEVPDSDKKELGPIEGRSIQVPRGLWKDAQKKAIDLDLSASALIVKWMLTGMARYGVHYKGGEVAEEPLAESTEEERDAGETIPMSETVTSSRGLSDGPRPGEGEGGDEGAATRTRRRA